MRDAPEAVQRVRVTCACGAEHVEHDAIRRIECDCGRVFAVSVSELRPPDREG